MKKIIFLLTLTLLPLVASAYDAQIDGIYYNIITKLKLAKVTSGDYQYTDSVAIPATVTYNGVTCNVTEIEKEAFNGCLFLRSVSIPNSVTSIGGSAFANCLRLTSVTIPNSVTSIGSGAFSYCPLYSVHISDLEAWCKIEFSSSSSNPLYYAKHLFMDGKEIKDLVIPSSVTSIGNYAFSGCTGLTSVTIPNSVTSIGKSTFYDCSKLTSVHITDLAAWCKIEFSSSSSNPLYYAKHLFMDGKEIKDLVIPNSVTSIGNYAFFGCTGLTSVTITNSVTSIESCAFSGCSGLTSVTIPNSVTSIGGSAFSGCSGLTSVTIPNSVTSIGGSAFSGCSKLISVTIPNSVTEIGSSAFANCAELTDVYCHATSVPSTESNAFENSYIEYTTLHVPESSVSAYQSTSPWSGFGSFEGILRISINETNFPDENFRNWILSQDYGSDGVLTDEEIASVNRISLPNSNIKDMKGIEYFTELTFLECYSNMLTALDLSNNTKLRTLYCYANKLTSLDLSKNTALTNLTCSYNQLASLILSNNSTLRNLFCQMNNIEGKAMDALVANLPTVSSGTLGVIYNDKDGNVMTTTQVATAKAKGWSVQCTSDGSTWQDYAGIDPEQVSAYAMLENNILTFYYDNKRTERSGVRCNITKSVGNSWGNQDADSNIKKVVFDTSFADYHQITTTAGWFYGCTNLTEIEGLEYLNTENVTNMYAMFAECKRLTSLDLSNFNTENVTGMSNMFFMCSSLKTIYVKADWNMSKVTDSEYMFANCISLSGQAGTWYDYTKMDNTYARIDEGAGWPGYFTLKKPSEPTVESVEINETNFPDENFRSYLLSQSYGEDGIISDEEIPNIKEIDVSEKSIQSLKGIEYFAYLKKLHCERNSLTSLDVAKNKELTVLYCHNNQITSLDISNNTALTYLSCDINKLTTLDVSNNTVLTDLYCSNNQITSLDVSNNTQLEYFACYANELTSLDVSKNTSLVYLHFGGNEIKSIDLTNNTSLRELWLWKNQLTTLDISKNTALKYLYCYNNQLESLDVSKNTALTELECYCNHIKGEAMDALVASLPTVNSGMMQVIYNEDEGNEMTVAQVAVAKKKGWIPQYYDSSDYSWKDYAGSEPALRGDVNGDGIVNGTDIQAIINAIVEGEYDERGDVNEDGQVNGTDIQEVINIIVNTD